MKHSVERLGGQMKQLVQASIESNRSSGAPALPRSAHRAQWRRLRPAPGQPLLLPLLHRRGGCSRGLHAAQQAGRQAGTYNSELHHCSQTAKQTINACPLPCLGEHKLRALRSRAQQAQHGQRPVLLYWPMQAHWAVPVNAGRGELVLDAACSLL